MPPGDGEPGAGRGETIPVMDPYKGFGKGAGEREGERENHFTVSLSPSHIYAQLTFARPDQ